MDDVLRAGQGVLPASFDTRLVTCHSDSGARSVGQLSPPSELIADSVYYPLEVEGVPTPAVRFWFWVPPSALSA